MSFSCVIGYTEMAGPSQAGYPEIRSWFDIEHGGRVATVKGACLGSAMKSSEELAQENAALRERLSRLSEASLRINQSLDLETVLQGVLDSARVLTEARYGVFIMLDDSGQIQDYLSSGMSVEDDQWLAHVPGGPDMFRYLTQISAPTRLRDFQTHMRSLGLPEFSPTMPVSPALSYLGGAGPAPGRTHRGHLPGREGGWTGVHRGG